MRVFPLSYGQLRFLESSGYALNSSGRIYFSYDILGWLNVEVLVTALRTLIHRYDALRLRMTSGNPPSQYAVASSESGVRIDLQAIECENYTAFVNYVASCLDDELAAPHNLTEDPPACFLLLRYTETRHALIGVFSRFAVDGPSRNLLSGALWEVYDLLCRGSEPSDEPAPSFCAAAKRMIARHSGRAQRNADYWKRALSPGPGFSELINALARSGSESVVRSSVIQAASRPLHTPHQWLLWKFASTVASSLCLSTMIVLLPTQLRAIWDERTVGMFGTTVPLVLRGSSTLREVHEEMLRAIAHGAVQPSVMSEQYANLERVGLKLADMPRCVFVNHVSPQKRRRDVAGLEIREGVSLAADSCNTPLAHLEAHMFPDEISATFFLNGSLFSAETAARFGGPAWQTVHMGREDLSMT